jgi:hypothetical protein
MPVNYLSVLGTFLASHLVILTLLLFLAVGLRLGGVWGAGDGVAAETPPQGPVMGEGRVPSDMGEIAPSGRPPVVSAPPSTRAADLPPEERDRPRPSPRLIGGSLPVYGVPTEEGPSSGPGRPPDDGFRPPGFLPTEPAATVPSHDELIQQARRAFWNGDFEGAEAAYMTVLSQYPGDPDVFGELGNLYQSMGKPQQALDAYFEAAVRLKAQGDESKLNKIIVLLEEQGDPRGSSLRP